MIHFVFDVESVGLHGDPFAVGYVVVDDATGDHLEWWRGSCSRASVFAENDDARRWVLQNIPLFPVTHDTPALLRDEFWNRMRRWIRDGALVWADCAWPVEATFLMMAADDRRARSGTGPYPLHEIATLRLAVGLDPTGTEERLSDELPLHDPLCDARQSARLLLEALDRNRAMLEATPALQTLLQVLV